VTFIDADRLWLKAQIGLERAELPLAAAFCAEMLQRPVSVVIPDLAAEPRFAANPLYAGSARVRFYAGAPLVVAEGQVLGAIEVMDRRPRQLQPRHLAGLRALARQAGARLEQRRQSSAGSGQIDELRSSHQELSQAFDLTLVCLASAIDLRDHQDEGHMLRVAELTVRTAAALGVAEAELNHVRRGVLLHDIGKMLIPDSILLKPASLTDEEWQVVRQHQAKARELLWPVAQLRPALDIPYCHHERWDGQGYPRQLKGEDIPLSARIFAVVDVWDALLCERPYRAGWPLERVADYLRKRAGFDFDPLVVNTFLHLVL
jgi:response regulator RpfG family c-di-GMP phosphodiesterase